MKKFLTFFVVIVASVIISETVGTASINHTSLVKVKKSPSYHIQVEKANREIACLAKNIYFEAAVESTAGKLAVALVTHNRVVSEKFPNTYCEVVQQGKKNSKGNYIKHKCAFSWMCDGKPDKPWNGDMWKESQRIAKLVYTDHTIPDITDGSTHYHADYVNPYWANSYKRMVRIDRHIFYR